MPKPESPGITADIIVVKSAVADGAILGVEEILLVERLNEPFGWALPGGFVNVGEHPINSAKRELQEETSIDVDVKELEFFGLYADPKRDLRYHNMTLVYNTIVPWDTKVKAGDDAKNYRWATFHEILGGEIELAFDHNQILTDFLADVPLNERRFR